MVWAPVSYTHLDVYKRQVQDGTGGGGVRFAEKVSGIALGQDIAVSPKILLYHKGGAGQHEPHDLRGISGTENVGTPGTGDFRCTDTCLLYTSVALLVGTVADHGANSSSRSRCRARDGTEQGVGADVGHQQCAGHLAPVSYTHLFVGRRLASPTNTLPLSFITMTRPSSPCLLYTSRCV